MAATMTGDLPVLTFVDQVAFESWIAAQPSDSADLWVKFAKRGSGVETVSKSEAIDVALCHGWIDGQLKPFDDAYWLVRFTPRRARSKWSAINRARADELVASGRMRPAGLAQIALAKSDGRWEAAYAPQSQATVPDDLEDALKAAPVAKALFEQLDSANRYAVLYRVQDTKTPQARVKRIETLVAMLNRGETIHPRRNKN